MNNVKKEAPLVLITFLVLILMGAAFYHQVEGLSYLDASYFTVMTITTIGYGDIVPLTPLGKIFTIFFAIIGIAVMLYALSIIGKHLIRLEIRKTTKNIREAYKKDNVHYKKSKNKK